MDNVAPEVDFEQLWACASSEDVQRTANLARNTLEATAAAIVSVGAEPVTRCVSDAGGPAAPEVVPADLAKNAIGRDEDEAHQAHGASISVPLLHTCGREAGRLWVTARPPRAWSERDRRLLADLAAQLMSQIELRSALSKAEPQEPPTDIRAKLFDVADRIPGLVFERRKLDAGRSAYTFFGAGKAELPAVRQMMEAGVAGLNFIHRDDREAVRAAILRSNLEETDLDLTFRVKDIDRSVRWVRSQSIVRREADGTVCWDGLCFDVTDLVAAREDAARISIETLLSSVRRELREPLQAVVGLAELAKSEDPAERVSSACNIQVAAESMIDAIDRVMGRVGETADPKRAASGSAACERTPPQKNEVEEAHRQSGVRILVADDLDLNRKLVSDMLAFEGHTVDCVTDGADAVNAARHHVYDLILMDMIMPGMDGIAATKAIRALPPPAGHVPIIALTAHSEREPLAQCLAAGMDATLTKPMSLEELANVVATWTRSRQAA